MRGTATITTAESGLAGGYVIPYQFSYELEKTMAYYGPMLNVSRIITTPQAGTLYWPKVVWLKKVWLTVVWPRRA